MVLQSHLKYKQTHWVNLQDHENLPSGVHPNTYLLVSVHILWQRGTCKLEDPPWPRVADIECLVEKPESESYQ